MEFRETKKVPDMENTDFITSKKKKKKKKKCIYIKKINHELYLYG